MVKSYFEDSHDGTADPPELMSMLRERVGSDDKFLLLVHREHGVPVGFMCSEIKGRTAYILAAYLPPKLTSDAVIDEALRIFGNWAWAMDCTEQKFYTFRHPRAHKLMLKRGWKHFVSVYSKEINHGIDEVA